MPVQSLRTCSVLASKNLSVWVSRIADISRVAYAAEGDFGLGR